MVGAESIQNYLSIHHPTIAVEVNSKLQYIPCSMTLAQKVSTDAAIAVSDKWKAHLVTISTLLVLCSPETIHANSSVKRNSGVATLAGKALGISQQCVSRKIERAVHYYTHVGWCRIAVDNIVKEVRGEG